MQSRRLATKILGAVFGAAVLAVAQTAPQQPDALDLLKKVQSTYRAMKTYSAKSTNLMVLSDPYVRQEREIPTTLIADSSGRMRVEGSGLAGIIMVSDGTTMWRYLAPVNMYSKLPSPDGEPPGAMGEGRFFPGPNSFAEYKAVASQVKDAKILGSATLHVNGSDADCWVVSVEYRYPRIPPPSSPENPDYLVLQPFRTKTLWVDKARYLVYEEDSAMQMTMAGTPSPTETRSRVKFESLAVNPPVLPETFTFTPPAGATEMDLANYAPLMPSMSP